MPLHLSGCGLRVPAVFPRGAMADDRVKTADLADFAAHVLIGPLLRFFPSTRRGVCGGKLAAVLSLSLAVTGCAVIRAEKYHSGGVTGLLADEILYPVNTNIDTIHRATMITAALSLAAEQNVKNSGDARQAIAQINGLTATISNLYQMANSSCGLPKQLRKGDASASEVSADGQCLKQIYPTRFEPALFHFDRQAFSLAAVALPREEFTAIVNEVKKADFIDALWSVLSLAKASLQTAPPMFAVGREAKQERVYAYLDGPKTVAGGVPVTAVAVGSQAPDTVIKSSSYGEAAKYLKDHDAEIDKADITPSDTHLFALFATIQQSCYNIRSTLKLNDRKHNNCPREFIGKPVGIDGINVSRDENDDTNYKWIKYSDGTQGIVLLDAKGEPLANTK